jgi:hypothetical protein
MKWWAEPLGPGNVTQHQVRVFNQERGRGLFVASSGCTSAAVAACRKQLNHAPLILTELREFVSLLDAGDDLAAMLRAKVDAAVLDREPLRPYAGRGGGTTRPA